MQSELRTARLLLRPLIDDDADAFAAMHADPRAMVHFPAPLSREESDATRARVRENGLSPCAVELLEGGGLIGIVGLFRASFEAPFTPCVELGWRIAAAHWNRGYATEAARAAMAFGFEQLGLPEILAWTAPENLPSRRVMQKLGMIRDPAGDFDHPRVPEGHRLRRHVLYRMTAHSR